MQWPLFTKNKKRKDTSMVPKPFKAAVGALAAMATLAMGFTGTAMAADTRIDAAKLAVAQPITVTSNMDISGKNLVAVQLAKYSYAQTDGTNITGFDLVDSGKNTAVANALKNAGINTSTTKSGAYAYNANNPMIWVVQNLLDSTNSPWTGQLRNFLNKLNHESAITGDAGVKLAKGANANTMTASVTPGVYAIIDRTTTGQASIVMFNGTGIDGKTTLKNGNTNYTLGTVSYKTHGTTVSKKITAASRGTIEGNGATAETSIGKTVSFELTSQVPNWTGFDKYYYALNDTYSAGLTFDPSTVKVNVNGKDLVNDSTHTYWKVTTESGKFHVIFAPTADANAAGTASDIVAMGASYPIQTAVKVTYTMTVNKNAVPQTADTNTVNVEYSRNPNTVTDHTTTPGNTVKVWVGKLQLVKKDTNNQPLAGASFQIFENGSTAAVTFVKSSDGYTYRKADLTETTGTTDTITSVSGNNGVVNITGLDGAYTMKETKSPYTGITILPNFSYTLKVNQSTGITTFNPFTQDSNKLASNTTPNGSNAQTTVINARSILDMPKTGSVWMTIFAAMTVLFVAAGTIILRKRA